MTPPANSTSKKHGNGALVPAKSAKSKAQILKDRALLAARKISPTPQAGETITVLEFQLECEKYGISITPIEEVCILRDYTRLPGLSHYLLGIMNLRGRIIAIVDLKQLFDLPRKGLPYHNKVIVISNGRMMMGLLADEIIGLRTIPLKKMQAELRTLTGKRAEYFAGVTPDWTAILDLEKILTDKSLVVNDTATIAT